MDVPRKNRQEIGGIEHFIIKIHGCRRVSLHRPFRTSFYFKISICCRSPIRMSTAKTHRLSRSIKRNMNQQDQWQAGLDLLPEELQLPCGYLVGGIVDGQEADTFNVISGYQWITALIERQEALPDPGSPEFFQIPRHPLIVPVMIPRHIDVGDSGFFQ